MSNFLAIASVTAALRSLLEEAVTRDVPGAVSGANVTNVRPDAASTELPERGINIFLFQATPNAAWRNADLPTRRADGAVASRAAVALDLHFLLSFYGSDADLEPQRLAGIAMHTLHATPTLTRSRVRQAIADSSAPYLATSDLADAPDLVRFTPQVLTLEELSRLWSVFFQTTYRFSATYVGSVVLVEGDAPPRAPLPVQRAAVHVVTLRAPVIEGVDPQIVAVGDTLAIRGRNLAAANVTVLVDGVPVVPARVTDRELRLTVPATLAAGVRTVQVMQPRTLGTPGDPHPGAESNVVAFLLAPVIGPLGQPFSVAAGDALDVELAPAVRRRQRAELLIGDRAIPYVWAPDAPAELSTLTFTVPDDTPTGTTLLRVRVDRAESALEVDPNTQAYVGPQVTIT